jgi:hypothetical protein
MKTATELASDLAILIDVENARPAIIIDAKP